VAVITSSISGPNADDAARSGSSTRLPDAAATQAGNDPFRGSFA